MLFPSGRVIATGKYSLNDKLCTISLEVCGEVAVEYCGTTYHDPESFPDELVAKIKANPGTWEMCAPSGEGNDSEQECSNVYVNMGNWFEYLTVSGRSFTEGFVCDGDISTYTPEDIRSEMADLAAEILGRSADK